MSNPVELKYNGKKGFKYLFETINGTELELSVSKDKEDIKETLNKISQPQANRGNYKFMVTANNGWLNSLELINQIPEVKEKTIEESIKPKEIDMKIEESLVGINDKLNYLQTKFNVKKESKNNFGNYKYRNCDSIYTAIKPFLDILHLHLVLSDDIIDCGGRIYIKSTAKLVDTKTKESVENSAFAREPLIQKGMSESQITGTASSYARKYAMSGLFLLDDTTDCDSLENEK